MLADAPEHEGRELYYTYPCADGMLGDTVFRTAQATRLVSAQPLSNASICSSFSVKRLHWHQAFTCFAEKVVYHFEGFGNGTPAFALSSALSRPGAFGKSSSASAAGWEIISSPLELQDDGSSCGV